MKRHTLKVAAQLCCLLQSFVACSFFCNDACPPQQSHLTHVRARLLSCHSTDLSICQVYSVACFMLRTVSNAYALCCATRHSNLALDGENHSDLPLSLIRRDWQASLRKDCESLLHSTLTKFGSILTLSGSSQNA